jgi:photosystem II stability/assembly factor-like uncharacterized protein
MSFIIPLSCFSQWQWQNPLPQGNNLASVRFVDDNTAFAVGDGGTILKTTDKGNNWSHIDLGYYKDLTGVFFVNPLIGFVTGADYFVDSGYIYKTTDGGSSWTQLPVVFDWQALSVWFTDENTGFVGTFADLYKTTDGGVTWNLLTTFPYYNTCWSMYFTDSLTGYIGTAGHIFKTTDGGNTWTIIYYDPSGSSIMSLYFNDQQTGYGVGGSGWSGKILKTTDAGQNWNTTSFPDYFHSVFFANNQTGIALGALNIYSTTNGGNSWNPLISPVSDYLVSGSFSDSLNAIAVGYHGATVLTNNMGLSWNAISSHETVNQLRSLYFIGPDLGFAAGDSGTIIKTTDGGNSWVSCPTGSNKLFECLDFTSPDVGYVCGVNNNIRKTVNSGSSWFSIYSSSSINDFSSIQFPTPNIGYVLCSGLMKTTDAGNTWNFKTPPGTVNTSMFFTAPDTGYFCGPGGQIVMTPDGGNSYITLTSGLTQDIGTIYFSTKYSGFIAGKNFISKTTDRGETWTMKFSGALRPGSTQSMHFSDSLHGYLLAYDTVLITSDGGETWKAALIHDYTKYFLDAIWFTDSLTGFIAGSNGIVLKTTCGGVITQVKPTSSHDYCNIYPNPNNGQFLIKTKSFAKSEIQIYNANGAMIYRSKAERNSDLQSVNLAPCKPGIYFLKITLPDRSISKKLIIINNSEY